MTGVKVVLDAGSFLLGMAAGGGGGGYAGYDEYTGTLEHPFPANMTFAVWRENVEKVNSDIACAPTIFLSDPTLGKVPMFVYSDGIVVSAYSCYIPLTGTIPDSFGLYAEWDDTGLVYLYQHKGSTVIDLYDDAAQFRTILHMPRHT